MKKHLLIFALALVPFTLSAQTRPAPRKSVGAKTSAARPVAAKAKAPVKKTAPAAAPVAYQQPAPEKTVVTVSAPVVTTSPVVEKRAAALAKPARTSNGRFQVGVRLGVNSSTIGGISDELAGSGLKLARVTGFHGGAVFNIGGPTFSVQPEILFSQYGIRLTQGSDYLQIKYSLVEVPVLLKASFGEPNLRFFVNAGPVATYAVSGVVSVQESGQSDSQSMDMSQQGRFAYGGSGGVGAALKAGPGTLLLEGRYTYLMTSQEDGTKTSPQSAMLSIGYLIPLGK